MIESDYTELFYTKNGLFTLKKRFLNFAFDTLAAA